jgi:pyroglutamyl-peptidase
MKRRLLLIYFETWLPDQQSNSSDDLLIGLAKLHWLSHDLTFWRLLPVDVQLASYRVLEKIAELWPDGINCCAMTEKQRQLSVESDASFGETVLHTTMNLEELVVEQGMLRFAMTTVNLSVAALNYLVLDYPQQS